MTLDHLLRSMNKAVLLAGLAVLCTGTVNAQAWVANQQ